MRGQCFEFRVRDLSSELVKPALGRLKEIEWKIRVKSELVFMVGVDRRDFDGSICLADKKM